VDQVRPVRGGRRESLDVPDDLVRRRDLLTEIMADHIL
jgi:hypothetical protein